MNPNVNGLLRLISQHLVSSFMHFLKDRQCSMRANMVGGLSLHLPAGPSDGKLRHSAFARLLVKHSTAKRQAIA